MITDPSKTNKSLGQEVHKHLLSLGIETPMIEGHTIFVHETDAIQGHIRKIMELLGLDLTDDSLEETPKRVAKMFVSELFWGLDYRNFPKATVVENKMHATEMVVERNISVMSNCEHHLLPIIGRAHVAYFPGNKVLGLSKLNRIVEFFSRRPQIQERLTNQIGETLKYLTGSQDVAVFIEAEHMCVKTRGVEDACSDTATSYLSGRFQRPEVRAEFFAIVGMARR